jgi:tetratricopeptide (TPR) repeat protein
MRSFAAAALALLGVLLGAPAPAAADKADALFAKGKAQLAKKQYAEACLTFERVDELDPGIGAKLNVAKCYEEWGRLVRARKWYSDAQKMAADAGDKRAAKIQERINKIVPDIPKLTINVPKGANPREAAVAIDGESIAASAMGRDLPVEPGPHDITFNSKGERKTKTIAIERGGAREVTLEIEVEESGDPVNSKDAGSGKSKGAKGKGKGKGKSKSADASSSSPGQGRRIAAFALMGAGALSMGVSGYLALGARGDYRSALDAHCMGAKDMCDDEGLKLTQDARSRANLGTVFAIVGVAMVGGGVALYLTAPSGKTERRSRDDEALYLAPVIGDRAGLVVLGGRY